MTIAFDAWVILGRFFHRSRLHGAQIQARFTVTAPR